MPHLNAARQAYRHTLDQYKAVLSASLYPIDIELGGSEIEFHACTEVRTVGCLSLIKVYANAGFQCRSVTAPCPSAEGHYLLQLQEDGRTAYVHRGRSAACDIGRLIVMDTHTNIVGEQFGAAHALIVKIPRKLMRSFAPKVTQYCAPTIDTQSGSANILAKMMRDFWSWSEVLTERDHQILPGSLLRLVDAAFGGIDSEAQLSLSKKSRQLEALRRAVRENCRDVDLCVDQLAEIVKVSRSTLYGLTRLGGTTVEQLIIDARLDQIEANLIDAAFADVSLTEIAFNHGFQDLSHFSRRFKDKFGSSPAQYRAMRANSERSIKPRH